MPDRLSRLIVEDPTDAAMAHAAERPRARAGRGIVDAEQPNVEACQCLDGSLGIACINRSAEARSRLAGQTYALGQVGHRRDRDHGTQDLLACRDTAGTYVREYRRLEEMAGQARRTKSSAAEYQLRAFAQRAPDLILNAARGLERNQRTQVRRGLHRIVNVEETHAVMHALDEFGDDRARDINVLSRPAGLTSIRQSAPSNSRYGGIEIGVFADDKPIDAAEFDFDPFSGCR